ncbi:MAG: hypothetical protein V1732_00235 [Patescibacteria group bacterium]
MLKWLIELFVSISSVFINGADKPTAAPPLNAAIISYQETYYAPAVTDPGNFPWPKKISSEAPISITKPTPSLPSPAPAPPLPVPLPPAPIGDPYFALVEPAMAWLKMDFTLRGDGFENPQPREFSAIKIDREYWKIEVFSYWAVGVTPPKPPVENDYFKLEIYEKGTDKLIYTMSSGSDEAFHKFQAFKKPGEYYFKTYAKPVMKYEINLFVSPRIAQ